MFLQSPYHIYSFRMVTSGVYQEVLAFDRMIYPSKIFIDQLDLHAVVIVLSVCKREFIILALCQHQYFFLIVAD